MAHPSIHPSKKNTDHHTHTHTHTHTQLSQPDLSNELTLELLVAHIGDTEAFISANGNLNRARERVGVRLNVRVLIPGLDKVNEAKGNGLFLSYHVSHVPTDQYALWSGTYIDNGLNLAEDGSDRLANEGDSGEEAGLADEDVEKSLVNTDKLWEIIS